MPCRSFALSLLLVAGVAAAADPDPEYVRVTNERAAKVVAALALDDAAQTERVQRLVAQQYRDLQALHDAPAGGAPGAASPDAAAAEITALHRRFVARLGAELAPEDVDRIKDGMTYGVVQVTYKHYLELLPDLSPEQRREILANLLEAREYAMDAGSSEAKHAWFGKYKGRINNYLSQAGYNLKAAEQAWAAAQRGGR